MCKNCFTCTIRSTNVWILCKVNAYLKTLLCICIFLDMILCNTNKKTKCFWIVKPLWIIVQICGLSFMMITVKSNKTTIKLHSCMAWQQLPKLLSCHFIYAHTQTQRHIHTHTKYTNTWRWWLLTTRCNLVPVNPPSPP